MAKNQNSNPKSLISEKPLDPKEPVGSLDDLRYAWYIGATQGAILLTHCQANGIEEGKAFKALAGVYESVQDIQTLKDMINNHALMLGMVLEKLNTTQ